MLTLPSILAQHGRAPIDGIPAAVGELGRGPDATISRRRVLVVEDEVLNALFLASGLEQAGFETVVAHDGVEALAALSATPVDAVVTDLRMPRMDGRELVTRLREAYTGLPILMVTAVPVEASTIAVNEVVAKR